MGRWEPLVLRADSRAARINLDPGGNFRMSFTSLPEGLPIQTPHFLPGQGQAFQEDCIGRIAHLTPQFPLPGDLLRNCHLHWISCSPQCRQYLCLLRRLIACSFSLHSLIRMASLTTSPQSGQKRTGAFARL